MTSRADHAGSLKAGRTVVANWMISQPTTP
jgi:hypothetical protein